VIGPEVEKPKSVATEGESLFSRFSVKRILFVNRLDIRDKFIGWATKGGLAMVDQGLISGSNFVVSIVLAR
jgi:hypothetical protein